MTKTTSSLSKLLGIIKTKKYATMPILDLVRVQSENGKLRYTRSDVDKTISILGRTFGGLPLDVCVPLTEIDSLELAKSLSEVSGLLTIECLDGSSKSIPVVSGEEYPNVLQAIDTNLLPDAGLIKAISDLLPFASKNEARYALFGVNINAAGELCSTDGHRAALADVPSIPIKDTFLESKTCSNLIKLSTLINDVVIGKASKDFLIVRGTQRITNYQVTYQARLADVVYPDYAQIFPTRKGIDVKLDGLRDFVKAIPKQFLKSEHPSLDLFLNGTATVEISDAHHGKVGKQLTGEWHGLDIKLSINANYLRDAIELCGSRLEILGVSEAIMLRSYDRTALIMPLRKR